ncbi:hypothetical protein CROQUDRAFT_649829 [Cronartium quercuum f. sp. fusiforme G11]|uniref:Palmitoyl-protein thioesterase 1 n=1 Tax=Cronartium quercuum f. sp. fusiforme G11 TaxID=708437 RepID=A0A9P6NS54_9BASI|nr:hypothetical protein CROQUDRAFT_649829 [Cronartium quercuum f. sp. fusiforme G11]
MLMRKPFLTVFHFTTSFAASLIKPTPPAFRISKITLDLETTLSSTRTLPVVIWHGLGDSYKNPGITRLAQAVNERYPGTSVYLIHLADRANDDRKATWFGAANTEVESVCRQLETIEELEVGFDAIGFSQGGPFMRAYVERCNLPRVRNLITLGAPHMGISEYPSCRGILDIECHIIKRLINTGSVYSTYAQEHIIPAQYFRDQADLAPYFQHNDFLRDINNERANDRQPGQDPGDLSAPADPSDSPRNQTYKQNMLLLENFVMFNFSEEALVRPAISAYFGVTNVSTSSKEAIPLVQLPIYEEDYIGLKQLDRSGRISYGTCHGPHMMIDDQCWDNVMDWVGDGYQNRKLVIQT